MTAENLARIIEEKIDVIWNTKPKEVDQALAKTRGTYGQSFFPAIYAESTTRDLVSTLMSMRDAAKREDTDSNTLKILFVKLLDMPLAYCEWCGLDDTINLLQRVCAEIEKVNSKEGLVTMLELLVIYFNRLNYWIDENVPWFEILSVYEWVMKGT